MNQIRNFLAEQLSMLMAKMQWSNTDLAAKLGVTEGTVRTWRRGTSVMSAEHLYTLWKDHRVSMDWFFSGYPPVLREDKGRDLQLLAGNYEVIDKEQIQHHLSALQELLTKTKKHA